MGYYTELDALPYIRPLLSNQHEDVLQAAQTAVENLTMVEQEKQASASAATSNNVT